MRSDRSKNERFRCHLCGGQTWRIVVRGQASRQQTAGHGEVSIKEYACTSRHHGQFFQVVECPRCHLRALFPQPAPRAVKQAYTRVQDDEYLSIERPRKIAFSKLLQRLAKYRSSPARLLDVGCSTGVFPLLAQQRGYDAFGVEPSSWAANIAATRLPGKIHRGYLDSAPFAPNSFDIITSWDVIEHVTDPTKEIKLMAHLLKPGGWLILSTMASEAWVVNVLGSRWPWYMPMHLFYFTPQTLQAFLKAAGLIPQQPQPYPHYTTVRYVLWKLEPVFGTLARIMASGAERFGLAEHVLKVDLGDFFLMAAQKPHRLPL